jgi:hypothetical protein
MFQRNSSRPLQVTPDDDANNIDIDETVPENEWLVLAGSNEVVLVDDDPVDDEEQKCDPTNGSELEEPIEVDDDDDDFILKDQTFGPKLADDEGAEIETYSDLVFALLQEMELFAGTRWIKWSKILVGCLLSILILGGDGQGGKHSSMSAAFESEYDDLDLQKLRVELKGRLLVVQHLEGKVQRLQQSNDRYSSDLALLAMDRSSWRSLAQRYEQELLEVQSAYHALETTIKQSKMLAPFVDLPPAVSSFPMGWRETGTSSTTSAAAMGRNNSHSEGASLGIKDISYNAVVVASSTALTNL